MNVLVTTGFEDALLDRMRAVSTDLRVTRGDSKRVDYSEVDVLYGNTLPRDPARAPRLKWVQLHMAGPDSLHDHPIYTKTSVALTTTSGVHAATVAEYAITVLLALAHRVPRMIVSPHVSGFLPNYDERCTDLFVENLRRHLAGAPLLNLVDRAAGY